jgi:hypothetical protein
MPTRIPIERLHLLPNVPAGMDGYLVMGLVRKMRKTRDDHEPILVREHGDGWQIIDGRHRFFAAVIGGRTDILAEIE